MQEIAVIFILVFLSVYTLVTVVRKVTTKPKSVCEDCAGCALKSEMIKKNKKTTDDCSFEAIK